MRRLVSAIHHALGLHQAGDLSAAQTAYQQILKLQPDHAMALHYLGLTYHQLGQAPAALDLMRRSILLDPNLPEFHCNLAVALRDCQQLEEAAAALCVAIRLRPQYPEALNNLGDVLRLQGKLTEARAVLELAIDLRATPEALNNLGLVLIDLDQSAQAVSFLRRAMEIKPDFAGAWRNLAIALRLSGDAKGAIAASRSAIALCETDADAWFGLGNALRATLELPEALVAFQQAQRLMPEHPELLINLAATYTDVRQPDAAIETGCKAIRLNPDSAPARYNVALALLMTGQLTEGWNLYESRWNCEGFKNTLPPLNQPQWDGSDPAGKTILLRAEQGSGDMIQFVRYVPLLAECGAKVLLQCQPELKSLLGTIHGVTRVVATGESLGAFNVHLPLLSLPHRFGTTLDTIPAGVPYLHADRQKIAAWRTKLLPLPGLRCGLVWAGNPQHKNDRNRSLAFADLRALTRMPGISFVSLQKGPVALEADRAWLNLGEELHDFSDTAACLMNLDLLISADTSVVHLAGALGRPVWTLLPHAPDWRWMLHSEKTPWYPTMRLFRQPARRDWQAVIQRVAGELSQVCSSAAA